MKLTNRRESPRIDTKLRCHITSPSLWAQRVTHTHNISRSGALVGWRDETVAAQPAAGQILALALEAMQPVASSWIV